MELFQEQGELRSVGMCLAQPGGAGCRREGLLPGLQTTWVLGGEKEKGTLWPVTVGLGVTKRCLQVVDTKLARPREAGELCGEGKRKPWGEGGGTAGDGVGVGAGGLEPRRHHFTSPGFGL